MVHLMVHRLAGQCVEPWSLLPLPPGARWFRLFRQHLARLLRAVIQEHVAARANIVPVAPVLPSGIEQQGDLPPLLLVLTGPSHGLGDA